MNPTEDDAAGFQPLPDIGANAGRIIEVNEHIGALMGALDGHLERLLGPKMVPEKAAPVESKALVQGTLQYLGEAVSALERKVDELSDKLSNLNSL